MDADLQTHIAFYLTGKRPDTGLDAPDGLDLRPALLLSLIHISEPTRPY